jgi:RNA polymerase sigma-70 factor (ECF subfamily)
MRSDIDQALALMRRGGTGSLDKALALLQQSVFAFGMRVCGQREDAEDTMQEVLVKALPYLRKFDSSKAFATWLYKVARNSCLMSRRKSKFAPKQELSLSALMPAGDELELLKDAPTISPEGSVIRGEEGRRLHHALRSLPPHYRIVLVLRDMEGFTDEEVGEITGLRMGTIRVRLHRARLFVRRELSKGNGFARRGNSRSSFTKTATPARSRSCREMFAGLSDYLDGQLDDFSCEEIQAHLSGCRPCKKFLRSLQASIRRCQQSPADCSDQKRAAALRKKLLATYSRALATSKAARRNSN